MKERMQYEDFFPSKIRSTPEPLAQVQPNCHRAPHRGGNCKRQHHGQLLETPKTIGGGGVPNQSGHKVSLGKGRYPCVLGLTINSLVGTFDDLSRLLLVGTGKAGNVVHGPLVLFTIPIPANDHDLRLTYKTTPLYSNHKVKKFTSIRSKLY